MPKRVFAVFTALFLLSGSLAIAGFNTAPKLREVQFAKTQITELAKQQIVLIFNQKITRAKLQLKPAQSNIPKPEYKFIVAGSKAVITVKNPLFNSAKYSIQGKVTAAGTGNTAAVDTVFTTATARLVTLVPGQGSLPDKIVQYQVAKQPKTLFEDSHVLEFNQQGKWLAAIIAKDANYNQLVVLNKNEKIDFRLAQPQATALRQLQFNLDNTLLGLKYFNGNHDSLRIYPLSSLRTNSAIQLNDAQNNSIPVSEWSFNQRDNLAAVTTETSEKLLFDPLTNTITNSKTAANPRYFGLLTAYSVNSLRLQVTDNALTNAKTGVVFYRPAAASSSVSGFCISPNKQYVAVAVTAADQTTQFVIINLFSAQPQATVLGAQANWCVPAAHADAP